MFGIFMHMSILAATVLGVGSNIALRLHKARTPCQENKEKIWHDLLQQMDCPTCKYPNAAGASFCGMCYEVLNRGAADAFLRTSRKERLLHEREKGEGPSDPGHSVMQEARATLGNVDWSGVFTFARQLVHFYRKPIFVACGLLGGFFLVSFLFSSSFRLHVFGSHATYDFPRKRATKALISFQNVVQIRSERQGSLDTPVADFQVDEIGNVLSQASQYVSERSVTVRPKEWIEIIRRKNHTESRTLPLSHPTLAPVTVTLDKNGTLLLRRAPLSPRLSRGLIFLMPHFPAGNLRSLKNWTEPVRWMEMYDEWKIVWTGDLHWTFLGQVPCGKGTCAQLNYQADLRPHLAGGPRWAAGAMGAPHFIGTAHGEALFDTRHDRLFANGFRSDGQVRLPIANLADIPSSVRIGRSVHGPGEIVIQFADRVDVHTP